MATVYSSDDAMRLAYQRLSWENQRKAEKYLQLLAKLQRAENKLKGEVRRYGPPGVLDDGYDADIHCSFCGKNYKDVDLMIAANDDVFICCECVDLCNKVIREKAEEDGKMQETAPNG